MNHFPGNDMRNQLSAATLAYQENALRRQSGASPLWRAVIRLFALGNDLHHSKEQIVCQRTTVQDKVELAPRATLSILAPKVVLSVTTSGSQKLQKLHALLHGHFFES
jgi:hypothetical protein